jgi:hypothetical protein
MTQPLDRYKAIKQSKKLLEELCDPGKTPRVPSLVRDRARTALRHFPNDFEIDTLASHCPDIINNRQQGG